MTSLKLETFFVIKVGGGGGGSISLGVTLAYRRCSIINWCCTYPWLPAYSYRLKIMGLIHAEGAQIPRFAKILSWSSRWHTSRNSFGRSKLTQRGSGVLAGGSGYSFSRAPISCFRIFTASSVKLNPLSCIGKVKEWC